jgi:hypothetical protein
LIGRTLQERGIKEGFLDFGKVKEGVSFLDRIALLNIPLLDASSNDGLQGLWALIRPQGCNIPVALDVLGPRHKQEEEAQNSQAHDPMPDSVRRTGFFAMFVGFEVFFGINLVNRLGG